MIICPERDRQHSESVGAHLPIVAAPTTGSVLNGSLAEPSSVHPHASQTEREAPARDRSPYRGPTEGPVSRTPTNFRNPMSSTPSALTEVPRVGVTAEAGEIAFLRCDHEPAQAHRRVGL
jgi:hypothetical protein